MTLNRMLILLVTTLVSLEGLAQATRARVDVFCTDQKAKIGKVTASSGSHSYSMGWRKDNPDIGRVLTFPANEEWKSYEIQIVPDSDGKIVVQFKGDWTKEPEERKKIQAVYDEVEVEGATLLNGSFEDLDDLGMPKHWSVGDKKKFLSEGRVLVSPSKAAEGNVFVRTWHDHHISQTLTVLKGETITIRFKTRAPAIY